jgi:acetyl-CoA acyltransferase
VDVAEAVIVEAVRTAHGRRNGTLAETHPVELMAAVLRAVVARTGIDPGEVDDVILGCVTQLGDQSSNIARFATLAAGWPEHVPGVTVNRACGSSQQALDFAAQAVMAGQAGLVVAGGVECMSRVPLGAARQVGQPYGPSVLRRYDGFSFNQGLSAEMIAEKWGLSRRELDEFSLESHAKAAAAAAEGAFADQVVPVQVAGGAFSEEECVRRDTSLEKLASLAPSFKSGGSIHAGNSSQIADGASALLVTTPGRARSLGLAPIARYVAGAVRGGDPVLMLTAPIDATARLLARTGLAIGDVGAFEVNEAFAPVPLAWLRDLGASPDRLNVNGGAIALGHPLGASGTSLTTRLVHHMRRHGVRYGLVTMCEGGGTANATLLELVA